MSTAVVHDGSVFRRAYSSSTHKKQQDSLEGIDILHMNCMVLFGRWLYLSAAVSLVSVAASASLTFRPSSSRCLASSAEASARLLLDSPADFASSRSAERRCSIALSSLVCDVWSGGRKHTWRERHAVEVRGWRAQYSLLQHLERSTYIG